MNLYYKHKTVPLNNPIEVLDGEEMMKKYIGSVLFLIAILNQILLGFHNLNIYSPKELLAKQAINLEDVEIDELSQYHGRQFRDI